jgi:hypothetical protein
MEIASGENGLNALGRFARVMPAPATKPTGFSSAAHEPRFGCATVLGRTVMSTAMRSRSRGGIAPIVHDSEALLEHRAGLRVA